MRRVRGTFRLLLTLATAFEYCLRYFLLSLARGFRMTRAQRARWLHECCSTALRRLGVPVAVVGQIPERGLLAANHLSYLDILVLSAVCECAFVAKREVRYWPVFGWMATLAGTVYVDRERPLATASVNDQLAEVLRSGLRVVMFPESTSTDGSHVLPFRSSLFNSAVLDGQPITATYLRFGAEGGSVANDVCYWGDMTFFPHLVRMLALPGVSATVRFGVPAADFSDRKQAARRLYEQVQALSAE